MSNIKTLLRLAVPQKFIRLRNQYRTEKMRKAFETADMAGRERLISEWFYSVRGEVMDFRKPVTFSQKIQWMKLYDKPELKGILADKYTVRPYVAERIGEEHLVPLIGVWDSAASIDFDSLPERFALKATHGAGWNILVQDKTEIDTNAIRKTLKQWLSTDYAYSYGYEHHYSFCSPRIIAEQFIESGSDLLDYKVFCFDGEPEFIEVIGGRSTHPWSAFVNTRWEAADWRTVSYPVRVELPERPSCFNELLNCAALLAKGFAFVRVDFYIVNNHIMFGEMTFTPASGAARWEPEWADEMIGGLIKLESVQ